MRINKTNMTFNYLPETRQLLITYNLTEVRNLRVLLFNCPFGYKGNYEIFEDGLRGRMIVNITSKENTDPNKYFTGKIEISLAGDYGFTEFYTINVTQYCSGSLNKFIQTPNEDLVVLPWWYTQTIIPYKEIGGAELADVTCDIPAFGVDWDGSKITLTAIADPNFGAISREGKITMKTVGGVEDYIYLYQFNSEVLPICRDIRPRYFTDADYVDYRILKEAYLGPDTDTPIYSGRAYKVPGEQSAEIHMNSICENYLGGTIRPDIPVNVLPDFGKPFYLEIGGKVLSGYIFYNSWNYDEGIPYSKGITVLPTLMTENYIHSGQELFATIWNCSPQTTAYDPDYYPFEVSLEGGPWEKVGPAVDFSPWEARVVKIDIDEVPTGFDQIRFGSNYYDYCPIYFDDKWSILYRDKNGAYSFLDVNGKVNIKNDVKAYELNSSFDNQTPEWERSKYMNGINKVYEANLNFLSKKEASKIDNLLESTEIYLCYGDTRQYIPVVIESNETDYKQNEKVRNYRIIFKASQTRTRK